MGIHPLVPAPRPHLTGSILCSHACLPVAQTAQVSLSSHTRRPSPGAWAPSPPLHHLLFLPTWSPVSGLSFMLFPHLECLSHISIRVKVYLVS